MAGPERHPGDDVPRALTGLRGAHAPVAALVLRLQKRAHLHKDNTYGIPPMGMARPGPIKRMM